MILNIYVKYYVAADMTVSVQKPDNSIFQTFSGDKKVCFKNIEFETSKYN